MIGSIYNGKYQNLSIIPNIVLLPNMIQTHRRNNNIIFIAFFPAVKIICNHG